LNASWAKACTEKFIRNAKESAMGYVILIDCFLMKNKATAPGGKKVPKQVGRRRGISSGTQGHAILHLILRDIRPAVTVPCVPRRGPMPILPRSQ